MGLILGRGCMGRGGIGLYEPRHEGTLTPGLGFAE